MNPFPSLFVLCLLLSGALGGFALFLGTRVRGEPRRLAFLAAAQLLEPVLSLGLFLLLEHRTVLSGSAAFWGFGLGMLQLAPCAPRRWSVQAQRTVMRLGRLGLARVLLSSVVLLCGFWTGVLENPGAIAGLDTPSLQSAFGLGAACFLAGVALFGYAVLDLSLLLRGLWQWHSSATR